MKIIDVIMQMNLARDVQTAYRQIALQQLAINDIKYVVAANCQILELEIGLKPGDTIKLGEKSGIYSG